MSHSTERPASDPLNSPYVRSHVATEDAWDTLARVALVVFGAAFVLGVTAYAIVLFVAVNN